MEKKLRIAWALARIGEAITPRDASEITGLGELVLLSVGTSKRKIQGLATYMADEYGWDAEGTEHWLEGLLLRPGEAVLI